MLTLEFLRVGEPGKMNATNHYLDRLAALHGGCSDYRLAQLMDTSRALVSQWRNERSQMEDMYALRLAELLKVSPMEVIAAVRAERSTTSKMASFWSEWAEKARHVGHAFALALAILTAAAMPGPGSESSAVAGAYAPALTSGVSFTPYTMCTYRDCGQIGQSLPTVTPVSVFGILILVLTLGALHARQFAWLRR